MSTLAPAGLEGELAGPWEWLHCENSITNSGNYLAAQSYRLQVEDSDEAKEQTAKAFRSLELIYQMGVDAGKPGWMGKPYGFRPSNQTSPDQYGDACWGLYAYHAVAPPDDQRKIVQMIVSFADYWRGEDYIIHYFGATWPMRDGGDYANAILMLINVLAYHFTKNVLYQQEAEWFRDHQHWTQSSDVMILREKIDQQVRDKGQAETGGGVWGSFAAHLLEPGEMLFNEGATQCKYVSVAADIIDEVQPDLLGDRLPYLLDQWWQQGRYGIGDDLMPYYWFAADFRKGTWRPLPSMDPVPPEEQLFGFAFFARTNQMRYFDSLSCFLIASTISSLKAPRITFDAKGLAVEILDSMNETRLHWMFDPDGQQLRPELRYIGECLKRLKAPRITFDAKGLAVEILDSMNETRLHWMVRSRWPAVASRASLHWRVPQQRNAVGLSRVLLARA